MEKTRKSNKGITLIALVITIIILLILASVTIATLTGENGILNKSQTAKEENNEKTATEKINLKITDAQMGSYVEKQRMPTLKELSLSLKEDKEISYVTEESQKIADTKYDVPSDNPSSIYTKLNEYPYEFEIDSSLRLASIDGIKVSEKDNSNDELKLELESLKQEISVLKATVSNQSQKIMTLENETIVNKRINLMNTVKEIPISPSLGTPNIDITLNIPDNGSIKDYKYIEIQLDVHSTLSIGGNHLENTIIIATEQLNFHNSNTANWINASSFSLMTEFMDGTFQGTASCTGWFKDEKTLHIGGMAGTNRDDFDKLRIQKIYGIK